MKCLSRLQGIEKKWQQYWNSQGTFMSEPPVNYCEEKCNLKKFFVTFPYPYMNGRLHLGHLFSATRAEFAVGYHLMKGEKSLFPFGFHVTGMPICGAAKKLADEIDHYGCPPVFPSKDTSGPSEGNTSYETAIDKIGQFKAKKNKLNAKTVAKSQWEILADLGIPEKEIPKFTDPYYWVLYFPALCYKDMRRFGARVDWRRSMITTDANPYYDMFIRWQFRRLYRDGYIKFGKRNCIWSPLDGQACMDHDRFSGEGVQPQEYIGIKLELINYDSLMIEQREQKQGDENDDDIADNLAEKMNMKLPRFYNNPKNKAIFDQLWENQADNVKVYLLAATLRPETMVGQTNCWVLPTGRYGAYYINEAEVIIVSEHAALNMAYQGLNNNKPFGEMDFICEISGADLLLTTVRAPLSPYEQIFVLPLETVKMDKGTGIVTSVPSDAPDDYACYKDILENRNGIADKYGIDVGLMLEPYSPLPIIEIPDIGTLSAVRLCDDQKVSSQHDKTKLTQIKEICYTKGFYTGVMKMGPFAGQYVKDCKQACRDLLIQNDQCIVYSEPESEVISRSNCVCVVAAADQWYLDYGNNDWKDKVRHNIENYLNTYHEEVKNQFIRTVDGFREWAASRSFGLGTKLPFDEKYVIESLSDSTIYNAYYTIAHYLQGGSLDGSTSLLPIEIIDDAFFDYVFDLSNDLPEKFIEYFNNGSDENRIDRLHKIKKSLLVPGVNSKIILAIRSGENLLNAMRESFCFWYPVDLRCSGKDLVPNHLTMMLYNHTAIWANDETKWPRGMRANGHLQLNDAKMSKAAGNFLTASEAMQKYGADAVRFALADAGDGIDDANFREETANNAVLRLYNLLTMCQDLLAASVVCYPESYTTILDAVKAGSIDCIHECVFLASITDCALRACSAFERCNFREGLIISFNELGHARDQYIHSCETRKVSYCRFLIEEYINIQAKLLAVICPHVAEELNAEVLNRQGSIFHDPLPCQDTLIETMKQMRIFLKMDDYVQATIVRLKNHLVDALKPRKDGSVKLPNGAKIAQIYVAQDCPEWQTRIAEFLSTMYYDESEECGGPNALPKDASSRVSKYAVETLQTPKKDLQKVMKYAAQLIAASKTEGPDALVTKLPFSEHNVLVAYAAAVKHGLGVEQISFYTIGEGPMSPEYCKAAIPGKPIVFFE